jgi:hypothetical protein
VRNQRLTIEINTEIKLLLAVFQRGFSSGGDKKKPLRVVLLGLPVSELEGEKSVETVGQLQIGVEPRE